jgi:hypothetical protein
MRRIIRRLLTASVIAALLAGSAALPVSASAAASPPAPLSTFTAPLVFRESATSFLAYEAGPVQASNYYQLFRATRHSTVAAARAVATSATFPGAGEQPAPIRLSNGRCLGALGIGGGGNTLVAHTDDCDHPTFQTRWSVSLTGIVTERIGNTSMGHTQAADSGYFPFSGLRPAFGAGVPLADARFDVSPLVANITRINHIARSVVLTGTATPQATIRVGSQTSPVNSSGIWTMTVGGLSVGANSLRVEQVRSNIVVGSVDVRPTIIDGGTLVPAPTSRVDLTRGASTDVPFIVENEATRTNMVGVVELTAPEGSTFTPGQTTVTAGYNRAGEGSAWSPYAKLDLKNGRLGDSGRTLTFDLDTAGGNMTAGEYYRYVLSVDTPASSAPRESRMGYVYRGDSSAGDYRAAGATETRVAGAGSIDTTVPGTVPGGTTGWARSDVRLAETRGAVTLTAPAGSRFADVEARRTADDARQTDYRVGYSADRRTATIDGPADGTDAFWGSGHQYAAFRLTLDDDLEPGTTLTGGGAAVRVDGTTLAEGVFEVAVSESTLEATPDGRTTLTRGDATGVGFGVTATGDLTRVEGRFELTAPAGTTFAPDQDSLDGRYRHPGADWVDGGEPFRLIAGERSADGRSYTYDYEGTTSHELIDGTRLRWAIDVETPAEADAGMGELGFTAAGTTSGGDFRLAGGTPVVVDESAPTLTAEVTVVDDVTRPATIGGIGDEGGSITVREGTTVLGVTRVVDGRWSLPVPSSVGPGRHVFDVAQTVAGRPFGSVRTDIDLGAAVDLVEPTDGKVVPGPTTVRGTGAPDAEITVTAADRTATATVTAAGTWEARVEIRPGHTAVPITASQHARGDIVTTDTTRVVPDAPQELRPVVITEPASHFYAPLVGTVVEGTATPYATVEVGVQWGFDIATVTADVDGRWSFERAFGPSARYELTARQTLVDGRSSASPVFELYADGSFVPLVVTSHDDGGTYVPGTVTFTGRATQGAYIEARNQYDRLLFSTRASQVAGAWTATTGLGPVASYEITVTQQAPDGTTGQTTLRLEPELPFAELAVTSHVDGQTYRPGSVVFAGTGTPTARVVATNQYGVTMGETVITAGGTWSFDRELGPDADYEVTLTQRFRSDEDAVTLRLLAPVWQPLALTTPSIGDRYAPGEAAEFTGTATPYSTVTATTALGGVLFSVETGADGVWRNTRVYGPDNVYRIDLAQVARNGRTDALDTFVWAPDLPWAPLTVTSHVSGETYRPGELELRGTGAPGAVVEITNQWGTPVGRPAVRGDGTWSMRRTFGPTADYTLRLVMTKDDRRDEIERFELKAPVFTEIELTSPAPGEGYTEGRDYTMSGRATPFATVRAVTALGGTLFETTADRDGRWSNTRRYGPTHVYTIDLMQETVIGETGGHPRFLFGPADDADAS